MNSKHIVNPTRRAACTNYYYSGNERTQHEGGERENERIHGPIKVGPIRPPQPEEGDTTTILRPAFTAVTIVPCQSLHHGSVTTKPTASTTPAASRTKLKADGKVGEKTQAHSQRSHTTIIGGLAHARRAGAPRFRQALNTYNQADFPQHLAMVHELTRQGSPPAWSSSPLETRALPAPMGPLGDL